MAHIARIALAAWLTTTASSIALGAGLTTLSIGADYSSGNYGASERTEIFYVPVTAKHETGRWTLKLVVPYIRITGPSNVIGAADPVVTLPGAGAVRRTESGIGDVVASAFRNVLNERDASFGLDIGTLQRRPICTVGNRSPIEVFFNETFLILDHTLICIVEALGLRLSLLVATEYAFGSVQRTSRWTGICLGSAVIVDFRSLEASQAPQC